MDTSIFDKLIFYRSSDGFSCINGQCIDGTNICDGVKHCQDGSDETTALCKNIP